ncbi:MAG TPA: Gfo/Idh/MocA family oxidoreductase [Candidatus Dormibacteraeota bacterium]|nr:Gfo/Idh/MocA family oxidoreductase [Candidatus Dormibacteraeota bacterium]
MGRTFGRTARRGAADGGGDGVGRTLDRAWRGPDRGPHIARRLGWGVLGGADIADTSVMPAIAASSNGRLVAIASRKPERARDLASRHPIARVSATYEALVDDPEVEAVYIPLVNSLHKQWTLRAVAAGKHVLCEKPLGMNAAEAEEMGVAAEKAGVRLMEAFMYRFHPRPIAFVAGLRDPMFLQASFGFTLRDQRNYRMRREFGGGALLDVGCYTVNVARWILGEPEGVAAWARQGEGQSEGSDVDMTVSALLHFPSGATASVWASFESPEEQELMVVTKEGRQRLERPFSSQDPDPYRLMVESFGESVLSDRPVALPVSESVANMRVLDRIRAKAAKSAS